MAKKTEGSMNDKKEKLWKKIKNRLVIAFLAVLTTAFIGVLAVTVFIGPKIVKNYIFMKSTGLLDYDEKDTWDKTNKEIKEICDEYTYDTEYEDPYMIE